LASFHPRLAHPRSAPRRFCEGLDAVTSIPAGSPTSRHLAMITTAQAAHRAGRWCARRRRPQGRRAHGSPIGQGAGGKAHTGSVAGAGRRSFAR